MPKCPCTWSKCLWPKCPKTKCVFSPIGCGQIGYPDQKYVAQISETQLWFWPKCLRSKCDFWPIVWGPNIWGKNIIALIGKYLDEWANLLQIPLNSNKGFHSSKWRPFNSIMNERLIPYRSEDSIGSNPVALHVQGYPQVIQIYY